MKKATQRPTIQTRYTAQAKADRRQAALERRAEQAVGIETSVEQTRRMYANVGK